MNLDGAVKDLQREKQELEARPKNVNVALAALTKLAAKSDPGTQPSTTKPTPTAQPANKPASI